MNPQLDGTHCRAGKLDFLMVVNITMPPRCN